MAMDFSRNYSPPGVYIEEDESTLISMVGVPPTIVALVGPARGYRVNTEQVVYSDDAPLTLSKKGIDATSVTVSLAATSAPVLAADYVVAKVGSDPGQDYESTFVGVATPTTVTEGTVVFVTYRYTDPEYYIPKTFRNFEDVKDAFGEPLNMAAPIPGQPYEPVASPLSLAAMLAIKNGATDLVLCATTPIPVEAATDAAKSTARVDLLRAAYAKISSDPTVTIVVPVTSGVAEADADTAISDLHTMVATSASEGLFRFGIIGFDPSLVVAPDAFLASSLTASIHNRRLMLAYAAPGGLQMFSGASNAPFSTSHCYLAAAYAGRMQALPVQQALTKQTIVGFSGLAGTPLANSLKNRYSAAGVAVVEQDRLSRLTVRHGVTVDPTNINTREASVVRARDGLVRALTESASNSGLIGSPLDDDLILSIKSNVQGVLESAVSDDVIVSYTGLTLRQNPTDPSMVEVKFAYRPAYPLNYIVISFSIDMSNGATDLVDDIASTV